MLAAPRAAEAFTKSRSTCALRDVVRICLWPSSIAITGRLSPSASAREAKEWRQSRMCVKPLSFLEITLREH